MITKYFAVFDPPTYRIIAIDVNGETNCFVIFHYSPNFTRRERKQIDGAGYFDTWDDAYRALLQASSSKIADTES